MAKEKNPAIRSVRVLLVNTEKDHTQILVKRLAIRGIEAVPAFSGAEAIQVFREKDFDVVVLDSKLDDMDGIQVLKLLKVMDPKLPVIVLSIENSDSRASEAPAGAFASLTKPCDFDELIEVIGKASGAGRF